MTQNAPASTLPFLPFVRAEIDEETIQGVADVLRSGWITTGPQNTQFEAELSAYCGGRPVRTFNSGTATMEVGLRIAGVGEGDEVITTPMTWVSTCNVILETGATPVLVAATTQSVRNIFQCSVSFPSARSAGHPVAQTLLRRHRGPV